MWELDYKERWVLKNWCFWTVVLEKTLKSLLDFKEIKPAKGNQPWIFFGRTDAKAESPILWLPDATLDAGKDWKQEEKGDDRWWDEWHHWLDGHEFEQAPGVGDGQGSLTCYSPRSCKELDMTQQLNWDASRSTWPPFSKAQQAWLNFFWTLG